MSRPVTIVMVTYQSRDTVGDSLDAARLAYESGLAGVVVVDNASGDGTADFVADRYPWVTLIRSGGNLGYGRGCNLGFQHVDSPYVLFMNPDAVIEPAALETLIAFMEANPAAGIAAPAIERGKGGYQHAGGLPTPWRIMALAAGVYSPTIAGRPYQPGVGSERVDWVCGAALLVRSAVFERLGGFDPRFFLYFEETDLCRRCAVDGHEVWIVPTAAARHAAHASAKKVDASAMASSYLQDHYYQSRFYYLSKHYGTLMAVATDAADVLFRAGRDCARVLLLRPARGELRRRLGLPLFKMPPEPSHDGV